jgi:hypothetical protein
MGRFPSKADKFFYRHLRLNDFQDAHLTDILKLRATCTEVDSLLQNRHLMARHRSYLRTEIKIVRPKRMRYSRIL